MRVVPGVRKAVRLLRLLPSRPREMAHRVRGRLDAVGDRFRGAPQGLAPQPVEHVIDQVSGCLGLRGYDIGELAIHEDLDEFEEEVDRRAAYLARHAPFPIRRNADPTLARFCYTVCRLIQPSTVIETGVAYGMTTCYILKALDMNEKGRLDSVDLPPLDPKADQYVGYLVPDSLKGRWRLHRGSSRQLLPSILRAVESVDVFVHDSLHTYGNMRWEFNAVTPHLGRPSALISDDVESHRAFIEWADRTRPRLWATIGESEKENVFGVALLS